MGGIGFLKLISQAFPRPLPQSSLVFFPSLSLAFFFARTPLSERLEQANNPLVAVISNHAIKTRVKLRKRGLSRASLAYA